MPCEITGLFGKKNNHAMVAPMRRELLKQYIFALIAEGAFEGIISPGAAIKKATAIFAEDLPAVVGDIAEMLASQSGSRIATAVVGMGNDIIKDIGKRGIKAVWGDVQKQYAKGVEVNTRNRNR